MSPVQVVEIWNNETSIMEEKERMDLKFPDLIFYLYYFFFNLGSVGRTLLLLSPKSEILLFFYLLICFVGPDRPAIFFVILFLTGPAQPDGKLISLLPDRTIGKCTSHLPARSVAWI